MKLHPFCVYRFNRRVVEYIGNISLQKMENEKKLSPSIIMKAMDWAYDKAINGVSGVDSAEEMASDYLQGEGTLRDKANSLIRWQNAKAGATGFITGLGGLLILPVALPANITTVLFVQIRMIAAIAKMGGYDLKNDRVKSLVYSCLVASSALDVAKQTGIAIGERVAMNAIKNMSGEIVKQINQKVGFRLFTKFGEKGIVNFGKAIPVVGGIIGGLFDTVSTNTIGNVARDTFLPE